MVISFFFSIVVCQKDKHFKIDEVLILHTGETTEKPPAFNTRIFVCLGY